MGYEVRWCPDLMHTNFRSQIILGFEKPRFRKTKLSEKIPLNPNSNSLNMKQNILNISMT